MFHLVSRLVFKLVPQWARVFNASIAPSERIALAEDRAVMAYDFNAECLLFDAGFPWRFIGALPRMARGRTITRVAEVYFRGFEQGQGELRELGLSDEFMTFARQYARELARPPST